MENNYEYKDEIIASRKGFLGSSDAQLISKIDNLGYVPSSCNERLAILKGLYEKTTDFKTEAMAMGDTIENQIFDMLHSQDNRWESNPRYESIYFKRKNLNLLAHIDFQLIDEDKKIVTWIECKATNKDLNNARKNYNGQLYIENTLGHEFALSKGKNWKFNFKLCHYNTNDYDGTLNPDKIEMALIRYRRPPFNIQKTMDIINEYLETMTEYHEDGVVPMRIDDFPQTIQDKMPLVREYLQIQNTDEYLHLKELEEAMKSFKDFMYDIMVKQDITERIDLIDLDKSMKLKKPYDTVKFDAKSFKEDHKTLYKKYSYHSTVKGSVLINDIKNK